MYTLPAKPEPIGVVLDDAVELYRSSFRACWPISAVGTVLITALRLRSFEGLPNVTFSGQTSRQLFSDIGQAVLTMNRDSPWALLNSFLVLVLELMVYGALFAQIHRIATQGRALSMRDAVVLAVRRLPGMVVAAIVWTVAVTVGMLFLFVPGVYLWGKLEFWVVAAFADDLGSIGGLGRSWELTTGNWWRSVTALSVTLVVILVLGTVSQLLTSLTLIVVHDLTTLLLVAQIIQGLSGIFLLPMLPAAGLAIYYDLKLRREGADLLNRAQSMQTA